MFKRANKLPKRYFNDDFGDGAKNHHFYKDFL